MAVVETWVFELSNLKLTFGDEKTEIPPPPEALLGTTPGYLLNRVPFVVEGREWALVDLTIGHRPLPRSETDGGALVSGQLSTTVQEGDSDAGIEIIADSISMLVSFAICRDVAAFKWSKVTSEEKVLQSKLRSTKVHLYSEGGSPLI